VRALPRVTHAVNHINLLKRDKHSLDTASAQPWLHSICDGTADVARDRQIFLEKIAGITVNHPADCCYKASNEQRTILNLSCASAALPVTSCCTPSSVIHRADLAATQPPPRHSSLGSQPPGLPITTDALPVQSRTAGRSPCPILLSRATALAPQPPTHLKSRVLGIAQLGADTCLGRPAHLPVHLPQVDPQDGGAPPSSGAAPPPAG